MSSNSSDFSANESTLLDRANAVCEYIRSKLPDDLARTRVAVICGSGLNGLADALNGNVRFEFKFSELPYFPVPTVDGHVGKLVFGYFGKVPAVAMVGRVHFYEGNPIDTTAFPVRVFSVFGIKTLIVTNAAGGLNSNYKAGDLVVINDHINFPGLAGWHPLRGANDPYFGPRFLALSDAYDLDLRQRFFAAVAAANAKHKLNRTVHEGVYAFVAGPTYETRAESRMLKVLGADAVGMSTVPEIIVARHSGIRILAISLITNEVVAEPTPSVAAVAAGDGNHEDISAGKATHEEVIEAAHLASEDLRSLVYQTISGLE
ncbi:nucleoside phosphorylase domain-containing protein [Lipomyces japonicus]|uniref:nucleoside phosphorylase domain-containing protein n=1 Tax=Lipomyces japonicus TaxID=56871 RepID=UPI0034CD4FCE